MFSRLQYWWARRCALRALCVSLECSPETWDWTDPNRPKQGNVELFYDENMRSPRIWTLSLRTKDSSGQLYLNGKWGRRIKRAIMNARAFITLKRTVKSLNEQIIIGSGLPRLGV